jgi:hypothetical protein
MSDNFELPPARVRTLDTGPDWTRWQDEDRGPYLIRLASQVVFAAGTAVDKGGAVTRDRLWEWADRMLEIAHPTLPPVDIDLSGQ